MVKAGPPKHFCLETDLGSPYPSTSLHAHKGWPLEDNPSDASWLAEAGGWLAGAEKQHGESCTQNLRLVSSKQLNEFFM